MSILPNISYKFHSIPIKIPMTFLTELGGGKKKKENRKKITVFVWDHKRH